MGADHVVSTLLTTPTWADHGARVSCRAFAPTMPHLAKDAPALTMDVTCELLVLSSCVLHRYEYHV